MMMTFSKDPTVAEQQMHAIIYYLTAFGYIDADFDQREREFVRAHIRALVEQRARDAGAGERRDVIERWTGHFHEVFGEVQNEIAGHFSESVAEGESTEQFVLAKLKLRCFELFKRFDEDGRAALLAAVDELMMADGVVHPSEKAFRDDIEALVHAPVELDDADVQTLERGAVVLAEPTDVAPRETDHPFFRGFEFDYARDPATFARQSAADLQVLERFVAKLDEQRARGLRRLGTFKDFSQVPKGARFLDGHVYVRAPEPGKRYELLVLGDLHGCYSCLKAALLQADFFRKVQAHHDAPDQHPEMNLVLLGDYIDRGRFSYNGVLRTVMQLFLAAPDHVFVLRGNHEYYIEHNGRVLAPVRPAEAMTSLQDIAPSEVFAAYMHMFEQLPNSLVFDTTMFVHAGIPRDETLAEKWKGVASLNDPDVRFQMLWSDPSEADAVPAALQSANARFPFGRKQFRAFMHRAGLRTMIRGHERVTEGFRQVYDDPDAALFTLFSAGGEGNGDLPPESNYREVTPMALTIRHADGVNEFAPFRIDYARYNDPRYNAFFR